MAHSTKRPNPLKRIRLWLLLIALTLIAAFIVFAIWSDQHRAATLAAIQPPPELLFHDRLAQAQSAENNQSPAPELQPALDTIASWTELLQRKKDEVDGDEWDAIQELWPLTEGWTALSPTDAGRIIAFLDRHRDFMEAFRATAALGGPVQPMPVKIPDEAMREHLKTMRNCAVLIALDAVARTHTGEQEIALKDCIAGMQLYNAVAAEPSHMSQLVRFGMTHIVHQGLQEAFPPGSLSADQSVQILKQAQSSAGKEALVVGLQQDHLMWINDGVSTLVEGGWIGRYKEMQDWMAGEYSLSTRASLIAYSSPLAKPWVNRDIENLAVLLEHTRVVAGLPYYEARFAVEEFNSDLLSDQFSPLTARYASVISLMPLEAQADHEVRLQLLQIGLSLELYQAEHGTPPASLHTLSTALPDSTFIDPYTGDPFIYKPEGDTFLLYSVGRNLTDDGGRHDLNTGDFVWRGKTEPPPTGPS